MPPYAGYQGTAQDMADAMARFCTSASWLCYPSEGVSQKQIRFHRHLIVRMKELQDNLFFQSKKTKECMKLLLNDVRTSWAKDLPDKHDAKWVEACASRFSAMCKHVARAERNENAWVQQALYYEVDSAPDGHIGITDEADEEQQPEDGDEALEEWINAPGGTETGGSAEEDDKDDDEQDSNNFLQEGEES